MALIFHQNSDYETDSFLNSVDWTLVIEIDGSLGEGGGQIIRSSLTLSIITGKPFRIVNVRARRRNPGLRNQHLTAILAAAQVGGGKVEGASVGSQILTFFPGTTTAGTYEFKIGTAGSVTLVLQTVLPPLMIAGFPSRLVIEGGTHNPGAPTAEFVDQCFLPVVRMMGVKVEIVLARRGFYPPGGGRLECAIEPASQLAHVHLPERGALENLACHVLVVKLPRAIAEREAAQIKRLLPALRADDIYISEADNALSPGNVVTISIASKNVTQVVTALGERGLRAEKVAALAASQAQSYLASEAAVDHYLSDQLLIPMAIAGGGSFVTTPLSMHALTNIEVIKRFLPVAIDVSAGVTGLTSVSVRSR